MEEATTQLQERVVSLLWGFLFAVVDFWQVEKDTKDLRQMIESRFFAPSYARANNST